MNFRLFHYIIAIHDVCSTGYQVQRIQIYIESIESRVPNVPPLRIWGFCRDEGRCAMPRRHWGSWRNLMRLASRVLQRGVLISCKMAPQPPTLLHLLVSHQSAILGCCRRMREMSMRSPCHRHCRSEPSKSPSGCTLTVAAPRGQACYEVSTPSIACMHA